MVLRQKSGGVVSVDLVAAIGLRIGNEDFGELCGGRIGHVVDEGGPEKEVADVVRCACVYVEWIASDTGVAEGVIGMGAMSSDCLCVL
ncbi:hypothetical protein HK097_008511 [Rhizophlyctis rosea]|uniref:Uncharacterized protein n=1 Tax=Rhizophlyctis rosea TaxID=64517 RepID=A0AAD5SBS8_9FUNG|nr:hypothetical protein HK097_008511 [Rhizophlyctis rosea]